MNQMLKLTSLVLNFMATVEFFLAHIQFTEFNKISTSKDKEVMKAQLFH